MLTNSEIKKLSKSQLDGKWGKFILVLILAGIALSVLIFAVTKTESQILSMIVNLLSPLIFIGVTRLALDVANGNELELSNFVLPGRAYLRTILYTVLMFLITMLVEIVVGIIGIILIFIAIGAGGGIGSNFDPSNPASIFVGAGLGVIIVILLIIVIFIAIEVFISLIFAQTTLLIIRDHDDIGAIDAMKLSAELMKGKKWDFFCLGFSFIGWILLSIITLGVGLLFTIPYMQVSYANFYLELLKEREDIARRSGVVDAEYENIYRTFEPRPTTTNFTSDAINVENIENNLNKDNNEI